MRSDHGEALRALGDDAAKREWIFQVAPERGQNGRRGRGYSRGHGRENSRGGGSRRLSTRARLGTRTPCCPALPRGQPQEEPAERAGRARRRRGSSARSWRGRWQTRRRRLRSPPPPLLPTVAPTRVPTVHSPPPPSLLLPLPVSLLYTHSPLPSRGPPRARRRARRRGERRAEAAGRRGARGGGRRRGGGAAAAAGRRATELEALLRAAERRAQAKPAARLAGIGSWGNGCCQQRECTVGTWVGATVGGGGSNHRFVEPVRCRDGKRDVTGPRARGRWQRSARRRSRRRWTLPPPAALVLSGHAASLTPY